MSAAYSAPAGGSGGTPGSYPVFVTPVVITVARGFQLVIALAIMVMGGLLMHGLVMGPYAFAFVCGLLTLIVALYALLSEKVPSCRAGYNYWAVLALDLVLAIFWLSSMAAVAHLRTTFKYDTYADCYDNGDAFNAKYCYTYYRRRLFAKRAAVAGNVALAEISAIAGLSALELLLFVATFAYLVHQLLRHRRAVKGGAAASNEAGLVEMKISPPGQPVPGAPLPAYSSTETTPTPAPAPVPSPATAPSPYGAPLNYYNLQPNQPSGYAQPGSAAAVVPGQSPYVYQLQPTPSQTPAPPPLSAATPSPAPTPGPTPGSYTYNVAAPVGTPELQSPSSYPLQTTVSSPYEK